MLCQNEACLKTECQASEMPGGVLWRCPVCGWTLREKNPAASFWLGYRRFKVVEEVVKDDLP